MFRNGKLSLTDIKDGVSTTLLLTENIDAYYYTDKILPTVVLTGTATPATIFTTLSSIPAQNSTERATGFVWWDVATSSLPAQAKINGQRGDWDPTIKGYGSGAPTPPNSTNAPYYAARPASNHPGGVIVTFAGANTAFQRDDIDYLVYASLMAPNNAKASCTQVILPTVTEADYK